MVRSEGADWLASAEMTRSAAVEKSGGLSMNGFIIETTRENERRPSGQEAVRWIGIRMSAKDIISVLPGRNPSVVDRGPGVLARVRLMGLKDGEVREFDAY